MVAAGGVREPAYADAAVGRDGMSGDGAALRAGGEQDESRRARFDLRGSMRETYRFLYHYELTDADIDEILHMPLNAAMRGYAAFAH